MNTFQFNLHPNDEEFRIYCNNSNYVMGKTIPEELGKEGYVGIYKKVLNERFVNIFLDKRNFKNDLTNEKKSDTIRHQRKRS